MENNNMDNNNMVNRSGKVWAGLFIIGVGSVLLLDNIGLDFPNWLFRWHTLLIVIGLFIGIKHNFRHFGWLIMVFIGSAFLLKDALNLDFDFWRLTMPLILVGIGIMLIFKPKGGFNRRAERCGRRSDRWNRKFGSTQFEEPIVTESTFTAPQPSTQAGSNSSDYLDSVNVFGGSHQTIYSKNFRGGEVVAVFGGCDLNLTQADFEGEIEIDITAIFGGCKIIIPPGWQVKSEVTAIFGGLDDKRSIQPVVEGQRKLVVIRGIAMFGGVDIRNY
jgi:predicted membrane protein